MCEIITEYCYLSTCHKTSPTITVLRQISPTTTTGSISPLHLHYQLGMEATPSLPLHTDSDDEFNSAPSSPSPQISAILRRAAEEREMMGLPPVPTPIITFTEEEEDQRPTISTMSPNQKPDEPTVEQEIPSSSTSSPNISKTVEPEQHAAEVPIEKQLNVVSQQFLKQYNGENKIKFLELPNVDAEGKHIQLLKRDAVISYNLLATLLEEVPLPTMIIVSEMMDRLGETINADLSKDNMSEYRKIHLTEFLTWTRQQIHLLMDSPATIPSYEDKKAVLLVSRHFERIYRGVKDPNIISEINLLTKEYTVFSGIPTSIKYQKSFDELDGEIPMDIREVDDYVEEIYDPRDMKNMYLRHPAPVTSAAEKKRKPQDDECYIPFFRIGGWKKLEDHVNSRIILMSPKYQVSEAEKLPKTKNTIICMEVRITYAASVAISNKFSTIGMERKYHSKSLGFFTYSSLEEALNAQEEKIYQVEAMCDKFCLFAELDSEQEEKWKILSHNAKHEVGDGKLPRESERFLTLYMESLLPKWNGGVGMILGDDSYPQMLATFQEVNVAMVCLPMAPTRGCLTNVDSFTHRVISKTFLEWEKEVVQIVRRKTKTHPVLRNFSGEPLSVVSTMYLHGYSPMEIDNYWEGLGLEFSYQQREENGAYSKEKIPRKYTFALPKRISLESAYELSDQLPQILGMIYTHYEEDRSRLLGEAMTGNNHYFFRVPSLYRFSLEEVLTQNLMCMPNYKPMPHTLHAGVLMRKAVPILPYFTTDYRKVRGILLHLMSKTPDAVDLDSLVEVAYYEGSNRSDIGIAVYKAISSRRGWEYGENNPYRHQAGETHPNTDLHERVSVVERSIFTLTRMFKTIWSGKLPSSLLSTFSGMWAWHSPDQNYQLPKGGERNVIDFKTTLLNMIRDGEESTGGKSQSGQGNGQNKSNNSGNSKGGGKSLSNYQNNSGKGQCQKNQGKTVSNNR